MKFPFCFFNKSARATLLLSAVTFFASCSKENVEPTTELASKAISVNQASNGQFEFNYGQPVFSGNNGSIYAITHIAFDSGVLLGTFLNGHTELAPFCSMEFRNQSGAVALVVRHVGVYYGDSSNGGNGGIDYSIPIQLPPGQYQLTLRAEDSSKSLMVGVTGNPSTYIPVITDLGTVTINRPTSPRPQFYPSGINEVPIYPKVYFFNYGISYNTANFATNAQMRAFAQNQSTGTLYQLTPGNAPHLGPYINGYAGPNGVSFYNNSPGQASLVLNEPGSQFLPNGDYLLFIDSFTNKWAGGDYVTVTAPAVYNPM